MLDLATKIGTGTRSSKLAITMRFVRTEINCPRFSVFQKCHLGLLLIKLNKGWPEGTLFQITYVGCDYICSKPNQFSPSKWKKQVSEFYENSTKASIFYWSSSLESSCRWKTKSCRDMNFAQYINYSRIGRHPENLQTRALSKPSQCPIQQPRPHAAEKITSIFQCLQGECFPPAPAQEVNSAAARCSFWDMCFRQTLCLDGQFLPRVWGTKPPHHQASYQFFPFLKSLNRRLPLSPFFPVSPSVFSILMYMQCLNSGTERATLQLFCWKNWTNWYKVWPCLAICSE